MYRRKPVSRINTLAVAVTAASVSLGTSLVQAQALEEVIVTAQRREESIQDVPISITSLTGPG